MQLEAVKLIEHGNGDIWLKLLTDRPHDDLDAMGKALKKNLPDAVAGYTVPESPDFDRWEAKNPCQWIIMVRLKKRFELADFVQTARTVLETATAS